MIRFLSVFFVAVFLAAPSIAWNQTLQGQELVSALRDGGHVLVMRHASSPGEPPDSVTANPDNVNRERQLDENGRETATNMGTALRRLGISFSQVQSSPAYRTLETARYLGLTDVELADFLGNQGMQASTEAVAARLRQNVVSAPAQGNRLLITHSPNLATAFPNLSPAVEQGEVLIFQPMGGRAELVARVRIEQWPTF